MLIEGGTRVLQEKLYLFGRPKLLDREGRQVSLPSSIWRVLAIVASNPDAKMIRIDVADNCWGTRRLGALRKLLWEIREIEKYHESRILEIDRRSIGLSAQIYSDVRDLLASSPMHPLSKIYRGPYVDGIVGEHTWSTWVADQRERFREVYITKAIASLSDPGLLRSELRREAKRLLEIDPNAETALRVEMISDAIDGDITRLRSSYHRLEAHLVEAGRQPSNQTRDLYTRLIAGKAAPGVEVPRGQDPGVPCVCILPPTGDATSASTRLARSLLADVTIGLCRNSLFKIIAPHTADQVSDVKEVEGLGVSYLVTVDQMEHVTGGDQVVCSLEMLPGRRVLWSDRFDVTERYSVDTYNLITTGVLRSVMRHIDRASIGAYALDAEPTSYVDYLHGEASLKSLDLREIRRGRQHLRRAVDRSPTFAPAVAAYARSFQLEWLLTARGDDELLSRSEHYARAAIAADPYEARGHREVGFCYLYRRQFDLSIEHYQTAERLSPHHADIVADYADALVHDGQPELAVMKVRKAIELNPLCQDTYFWTLGSAYLFLERYQDAVASLMRMKDRNPVFRLLAVVHALAGNKEEASRCRIKAMELHPEMNLERWINIVPFRDPRQIQHYQKGLRIAGFQ